MKRTRSLFHTFYLVVIAVLATLLYLERDDAPDPTLEALADSQRAMRQDFSDLQESLQGAQQSHSAQLDQLLVQVSQVTRSQTAQQQPPSAPSEPAPSQPDVLVNPPLSNDFAVLNQQFEIQSVDPDWAYATRDILLNRLETLPALSPRAISDIECRSTLCRIELDAETESAIDSEQLVTSLSGVAPLEQVENNANDTPAFQVHLDNTDQPQQILVERLPAR